MGLPKGKIVTRNELAAILGYDPKTITVWQTAGLPYEPGVGGQAEGAANRYNTCLVIRWLIARETRGGLDLETERAKLAREQAEMAQMKNDEKKGLLIGVPAAIAAAQKAATAIRQKIVNSSLTDEEKRKLLIDINALKDTDFEDAKAAAAGEEAELELEGANGEQAKS